MARSGINKAVVIQARQALLTRGEHPSIDAVRIELGNTGSKSTIHRYLKELEESEAKQERVPTSLSDELIALIEPMAARLRGEAEEIVARMRQQCEAERKGFEERLAEAQEHMDQLRGQIDDLDSRLQIETEGHQQCRQYLHQAEVEQARLRQANQDQADHLKDRDEQVRSLEEKHQHSREALEHYRQASKEQREQEQRRHEGQLQQVQMELRQLQQSMILKQDEVTQLNRTNERLASENAYKEKDLSEQSRQLAQQAKELTETRTRLTQSDADQRVLQERLYLSQSKADELKAALDTQRQEAQALHIGLASADAELQLLRQKLARRTSTETPPEQPKEA